MTLYCPSCRYNLTGLPEDRCPECGKQFNRAALEAKAAQEAVEMPPPITRRGLILQFLWPPAVFLLPPGLIESLFDPANALLALLLIILFGGLWFGLPLLMIHATTLARRWFVARALVEGRTPAGWMNHPAVGRCALGLFVGQIVLIVVGYGILVTVF